jgi:uncharacterized membrane protein SirB2
MIWILVGFAVVAFVALGAKDTPADSTRFAVWLVALLFLGAVAWLWVSQ